ncbi:MAG: hypothetical protein M3Q33_05415 [Acidobacteriota bacterium]|nr:hypothetical protein [Acidobacteriota bacterium]
MSNGILRIQSKSFVVIGNSAVIFAPCKKIIGAFLIKCCIRRRTWRW